MKTWAFDEAKIDDKLKKWVKEQEDSGHVKAIKHAKFVAAAVKDVLLDSDLYIETEVKGFSQDRTSKVIASPAPSQSLEVENSKDLRDSSEESLTIKEMLETWNATN